MKTSEKDSNPTIEDLRNIKFHLTKEGSLGILAYGDLGLMAWRKVKQGKLIINPE